MKDIGWPSPQLSMSAYVDLRIKYFQPYFTLLGELVVENCREVRCTVTVEPLAKIIKKITKKRKDISQAEILVLAQEQHDLFKLFDLNQQEHLVVLKWNRENHTDKFGSILLWLMEHAECKWSMAAGSTEKYDDIVIAFSFEDLACATLFRLKF